MAGCSILDKVYLHLVRYLNVGNVKPYLKQKQLLTDDELERLDFASSKGSQCGVEALIKIIKRKGPCHEEDFLSVLKDSMEFDPHEGHAIIIAALEKNMVEDTERDFPMTSSGSGVLAQYDENLELHVKQAALRSKVVKANSDIKMKFTKLVLDIYRLLSKKKVPIEEIRLSLLFLGCFKTSGSKASYPVISPSSELSHAETIQSLIECLHQYSSWYNYGLIKFVAIEFGGEEGFMIIDEYMKNLTAYCEKVIAYQCPEFTLSSGLPSGYDYLVVKIDCNHQSKTAQDIAIFQAELSSLLNLEPEVFILKSVEEGCLLLTWAVPQSITTYIVMETIKQQQQLAKWHVLSIKTAGKHINIKQEMSSPQTPSIYDDRTGSESSVLSDEISDGLSTPLVPLLYGTTLTNDEMEIVSTYSGKSRHSVYSTVSQASSDGTFGFFDTKQFHSECDIIPQESLHIKTSSSLNVLSKKSKRKHQAKTFLKSMLPRMFKASSQADVTTAEVTTEDTRACAQIDFPIIDLAQEPTLKLEGNRVYSHYYFDEKDLAPSEVTEVSPQEFCDLPHNLQRHAGGGSKSDIESGLGSQNPIPSTTSEYSLHEEFDASPYVHVQRSQSMKCQCLIPNNFGINKSGRFSLRKLPQNTMPSLHALCCERVGNDTPTSTSSGYGDSQSGCTSIQSSLGSTNFNLLLDGASGPDLIVPGCCSACSSHKRNSITSSTVKASFKDPKKSARSHSFNGKLTIHHE